MFNPQPKPVPSPKKKRKRIPQISERRKHELKKYTSVRKEYLEAHPLCEVCKLNKATEIHHKKGKIGKLLNEKEFFLATDSSCHRLIEENPEWAYKNGYSLLRVGNLDTSEK